MDAALLAGADADGLTADGVADGIGLGVLQGDHGDGQIHFGAVGQVLVLGHDVGEEIVIDDQFVAALFEGHAEDLFALQGSGLVFWIDLDDAVAALFFLLQKLEGLRLITGSDDAIGDLTADDAGGGVITRIR